MKEFYESKKRKGVRQYNCLEVLIIACITVAVIVATCITEMKVDISTQYVQVLTQYDYKITATLFGEDISNLLEIKGNVNTNVIGEYTIEYVFKYLKFLPGFEKKICVVDSNPPEISLNGDQEVHVYDINYYEELGFSVNDDLEGDLTSNVYTQMEMISADKYLIKYFCMDSSGNMGIATRTIQIDSKIGDVYLTFDDGPSAITEQILKILEEKNINATFFIVGYDESKKYLIDQENKSGNTIGLHGLTHDYSKVYISPDAVLKNFDLLKECLKNDFGIETHVVRFPGGSSNTISKRYCKGVMTKSIELLQKNKYIYFDWNVDSQDAGGARTSDAIYQNVVNGIKPGITNVVLMHDSSGHQATADALEKIIDWCLKNGYDIKPINDATPTITHKATN